MADIDVTFAAPGAAQTESAITKVEKATERSASAAVRHKTTIRVQDQELRRAAQGARQLGDEVEKTTKKISLAKAAKFGDFGHAFKEASFIGQAAGAGAGGAVGLGLIAGGMVFHAFVGQITKTSETLEKMITAGYAWRDMVAAAAETQGKAGQGAIKEFGAALTDLIGRGGGLKELADEMAKAGHPLAEAQKATLEANKLFPGREQQALEIANDATRITGQPLSKSMGDMEGMPSYMLDKPLQSVAALMSMHRGSLQSDQDALNARDNIGGSGLAHGMLRNNMLASQIDLSNQANIGVAATQSAKDLSEALKPLEAAQLKQYNTLQQQLDIAQKTHDSQNRLIDLLDRLAHGRDSAAGRVVQAQNNLINAPSP